MNLIKKGVTLIEASAGTGKTYTLCRRALRLIAVHNISIDRILIVTFTQAATEELRERIRDLLRDSIRQVQVGQLKEEALVEAINTGCSDAELIERLNASVDLFDEASISTIHGFCKRALEQCALESGAPLDAELITVESQIVERLRDEFIRFHVFESSPIISAAFSQDPSIQKLLDDVGRLAANSPNAAIQPQIEVPKAQLITTAFDAAWRELQQLVPNRIQIAETLKSRSKFQTALKSEIFENRIQKIKERGFPLTSDLDWLLNFSSENLSKALKKASDPQPFLAVCQSVDTLSARLSAFRHGLANRYRVWLYEQLSDFKRRANVLSFNDLLHQLNRALSGESGERLSTAIASLFDAAFIDEFQDTDPIQYEIISRIFGSGEHYVTFIGDPKQAIYKFRGADIFAYFAAARKAEEILTLGTNYRSKRFLISIVNQLFENAKEGFAYEEIKYTPILPSLEAIESPEEGSFAFRISYPESDEFQKADDKLQSLSEAAVNETISLCEKFAPEDIAILVNTNKQADLLKRRLSDQGIESLIVGERSIYESDEVAGLEQLLLAVSRPSRVSYARAALLTSIFGYSLEDFSKTDDIQAAVEIFANALSDWNRNWEDSFSARINDLHYQLNSEERLFNTPNGETVLNNVRHLAEILDERKKQHALGPTGLRAWLQRKRLAKDSPDEASRVRLGSDKGKVRLITIHKSKGLQFKRVICPYLNLESPRSYKGAHLYHDPKRGNRSVLSLSIESDPEAVALAEQETLAEKIRLIYVALTRAEDHCSVILASEETKGKGECSTFAKFLLGRETASSLFKDKKLTDQLEARLSKLGCQVTPALSTPRRELAESTNHSAQSQPKERPFTLPSLPLPQRVASFSSIAQSAAFHFELEAESERLIEEAGEVLTTIDSDEVSLKIESSPQGNLFDLPKGAETGELLHILLEGADFSASAPFKNAAQNLSPRQAALFERHRNAISDGLSSVLDRPLQDAFSNDFTLRSLKNDQRLNELEFAFATTPFSIPFLLKRIANEEETPLPEEWKAKLAKSDYQISSSLLRGFIDLLFFHQGRYYILDWKSNHLGIDASDYEQSSLAAAMAEHDYYLQLLLYTIALKRYLAIRIPQRPFSELFGGAYYIFLRGAQMPDSDGIYYLNPDPSLIQDLDEILSKPS